jgi:hypothetical protein
MLTEPDIRTTVANAIRFFEGVREPHALLWLDVMHRRFGIEQFAEALERFDEVLLERPDEAPVLRVLRRIADADNALLQPDDWTHVEKYTDRMLVAALYCDRMGLPESFPEVLEKCIRQGGYYLTHALLCSVWIQENGCKLTLPDGLADLMYHRVGEIIDENPAMVNDLKLEAAAFLCLARQARRVDLSFVQRVVLVQNDDGGWGRLDHVDPENPERSSWHSSILALLLLLHVRFPGISASADR